MGVICLPGNPPIEILLRRSARAKRLSLRISQLDGKVTMTLPERVKDSEGRAFAFEKEPWIRQHLDNQAAPVVVGPGVDVPVENVPRTVRLRARGGAALEGMVLYIGGSDITAGKRVTTFLKHMARERLTAASDHYAGKLGREYTKLTLRDTRSRWGSCSSSGALMYSWRLILAPPEVLRYVAAHEVAHLAHMDHSSRFWQQVSELYGDYSDARGWLRTHGADLHRFRFDPPLT